jgi:hypothetical protein
MPVRNEVDEKVNPIEARCTIDTGNMQGNFVSTALVQNLGVTESDIRALTGAEQQPSRSVTGKFIKPVGAIYLTWFHKRNSARIFRNMRFLIADDAPYDMVIGARSIQKNGLLNTPNLVIPPRPVPVGQKVEQTLAGESPKTVSYNKMGITPMFREIM